MYFLKNIIKKKKNLTLEEIRTIFGRWTDFTRVEQRTESEKKRGMKKWI